MKKILLINEDFNEQLFLDTFLKKIGFDTLALRSEVSLLDTLLGFKPNVVIATGDGPKVKGLRIAEKLKKRGSKAVLMLLFPPHRARDEKAMAAFKDFTIIETPVNPRLLIGLLCDALGLNKDVIMQKFERLPMVKAASGTTEKDGQKQNDSSLVKVTSAPKKFDDILKQFPPYPDRGFPKETVQSEVKGIREFEEKNPDLKSLDKKRIDFVLKLFKKP